MPISDYPSVKPVRFYWGSITDPDLLCEALEGVHTVFHIAGKISYGTFPDFNTMYNINVEGKVIISF